MGAEALPNLEIVRSPRRKTISIEVMPGQVRLLVPSSLAQKKIEEVLEKRRSWIFRKVQELAARPQPKVRAYKEGELFLFRGKTLSLRILSSAATSPSGRARKVKQPRGVVEQEGILEVSCPSFVQEKDRRLYVQEKVAYCYYREANLYFTKKTGVYARKIGVVPRSIVVKDYKSQWGSCSSQGELSYNWRLIMAPEEIIDYVIVHELCHILEHNHSKAFWAHVARHFPAYERAKQWLRQNGNSLRL